jgi:hypothetical protein
MQARKENSASEPDKTEDLVGPPVWELLPVQVLLTIVIPPKGGGMLIPTIILPASRRCRDLVKLVGMALVEIDLR